MRYVFSLLLIVGLVACGKNEPVRPAGNTYFPPMAPPPTAPPPVGGNYGPRFQPTMPAGYNNRYTPFLPVDNYFRQNQTMQRYWQQMWMQWQQYAAQRHYSMYDFSAFWNDYCPQVWAGTSMMPIYHYYDTYFYGWVTPQTSFPSNMDPYQYWSGYGGYSSYSSCNEYCYW